MIEILCEIASVKKGPAGHQKHKCLKAMFAMTISQLFNDDVLKRGSIVSICQLLACPTLLRREEPIELKITKFVQKIFVFIVTICYLFKENLYQFYGKASLKSKPGCNLCV